MFPEIVLYVPLIPQSIPHCSPQFLSYFIFIFRLLERARPVTILRKYLTEIKFVDSAGPRGQRFRESWLYA